MEGHTKILGVCLGMQAIALAYGAEMERMELVNHGVQTKLTVYDNSSSLWEGLEPALEVGLYHSWKINETSLPQSLIVTARSNSGVIMGIRHRKYDIEGLQFHPESIMSPDGGQILSNWLSKE